jgi:hypothetical protein
LSDADKRVGHALTVAGYGETGGENSTSGELLNTMVTIRLAIFARAC